MVANEWEQLNISSLLTRQTAFDSDFVELTRAI